MSNTKPYASYKETGISWIEKVPTHWKVLPNRKLFQEIRDANHPEEQLLSVTISRGVIKQEELLKNSTKKDTSNEDKSKYKLVKPGDIVYNKMRAWQGAVGISEFEGIVSPAYIVQRPRTSISTRYFHYLYRTPNFSKEAERWSYGITSDQWNLRPEDFRKIYTPIPPEEEQKLIAKYLDFEIKKINIIIKNKRRLADLLNDQRETRIHSLVTGASTTDISTPYNKYKQLDIEWAGRIPTNWSVFRLKDIAKVNPKTTQPDIPNSESIEFLPMDKVNEKEGMVTDFEFRKYEDVSSGYTSFNTGDVLFAKITPCMENGNCVVVPDTKFGSAFGSTEFIVFRANEKRITRKYLHLILRDKFLRSLCEINMKGSAGQKRVPTEYLGGFKVVIPDVKTQLLILDYIEDIRSQYNKLASQIQKEILILNEYKKVLIANVATGKIDIKDVAKNIPETEDILGEEIYETEAEDSLIEDVAEIEPIEN